MVARAAGLLLFSAFALSPAAAQDAPALLRIGVVSPDGDTALRGAVELRRAFQHATGLQARIFVARDAAALVEAQVTGSVHYAVHTAASYAATRALCGCIEPVAAPLGSSGDRGVSAVIYVRHGGPSGLAEAARARIVAAPGTLVGPQLLAIAALEEAAAGGDVMLADSAHAAERDFAEGLANVLVGWEPAGAADRTGGTAARLEELGLSADAYAAIWTSPVVRYGPHAVRVDLPDAVKSSLRTFLVHLHAQQPYLYDLLEQRHLGGFEAVSDADYEAASRMVAIAAE